MLPPKLVSETDTQATRGVKPAWRTVCIYSFALVKL